VLCGWVDLSSERATAHNHVHLFVLFVAQRLVYRQSCTGLSCTLLRWPSVGSWGVRERTGRVAVCTGCYSAAFAEVDDKPRSAAALPARRPEKIASAIAMPLT